MEKKVLFLNPSYSYRSKGAWRHTRIWPPIDLANAAAMLEERGFHVVILDLNAVPLPLPSVAERAKDFHRIFVTSGSLDRWQCPHLTIDSFLLLTRAMKDSNPNAQVYIMGPHPTMRPREILETTRAHAAILGEPELTIVELCEDDKDLSSVSGIAYLNGNEFVKTKPREPADLSTFPVPAFHLLPMNKYCYEIMGGKFTLLETSRGCPYQCIFCSEDQMYGSAYRTKPIESIRKELDSCVRRFGVKNVYFIDLEFTLNKSFVAEICNLLIQEDYRIRWACQTRADSVNLELLKMMRKAGCRIIHYGLESGSPKVLESTQKRISLESIRQGVQWAKEAGMEVVCFTMMGLPDETVDDMLMSIEFAKEVNPDYISFHVATPYPGTKFHELVKPEVTGLFPSAYEGKYSEDFLKQMTKRAFREFYMRPRYILKRIRQGPRLVLNQVRLLMKFLG